MCLDQSLLNMVTPISEIRANSNHTIFQIFFSAKLQTKECSDVPIFKNFSLRGNERMNTIWLVHQFTPGDRSEYGPGNHQE